MADMGVSVCGVDFKNPVIAASGTFGFGREYAQFYDIGLLAACRSKVLRVCRARATLRRAWLRLRRACSTPWGCRTRAWRRS